MCAYVAERTGSALSRQQTSRLLAALDLRLAGRTEEQYLAFLRSANGAAELAELMASISVHKTDLFRDEVQLEAFKKHVLRELAGLDRPLRLWSAGCATGEEVATLLILLAEAGAHPESTVLGTDISAAALKEASTLCFHPELMRRVSSEIKARYFREKNGRFELSAELRGRATFQRHNLMDFPYPLAPAGKGFDVIFCRNVLIYFTENAFDRTVTGLADRLADGATLVLSAAEPILKPFPQLTTVRCDQAFFYRRPKPGERVRPITDEVPAVVARTVSGEVPRIEALPLPASVGPREPPAKKELPTSFPAPTSDDPRAEALAIFQLVLDWAAAGESDEQTEKGLRRCVYLDPHFAQARYLLAMLLEQRQERADAIAEYRRALAALVEGRSRVTAFFLNDDRLKVACLRALDRLNANR